MDKGYIVHGTVRDLSNQNKATHLLVLSKAYPDKLKLFEADLLSNGSFDSAIQDCNYVIHRASPFKLGKIKMPFKEPINPAKLGTINIL